MSSRNVRQRDKRVGYSMLAIVSVAIFAAQLESGVVDTAGNEKSPADTPEKSRIVSGPGFSWSATEGGELLIDFVSDLDDVLIKVTINESQFSGQAAQSDFENGSPRESF